MFSHLSSSPGTFTSFTLSGISHSSRLPFLTAARRVISSYLRIPLHHNTVNLDTNASSSLAANRVIGVKEIEGSKDRRDRLTMSDHTGGAL